MSESELERRRRLAGAVRDLNRAILMVDLAPDELDSLVTRLNGIRDAIARAPQFERNSEGLLLGRSGATYDEEFSWDTDPLVGFSNPLAPPVVEKDRATGEWAVVFGDVYEGHPGLVHGGYVAATLDHVLGVTASPTDGTSMTGTLTVRYRRPTPTNVELLCRGQIDRIEGRKVFCRAELMAGATLVAEAEGIFFRVDTPVPAVIE